MREQICFRKNALFADVLTTLQIYFLRIRKDKEKSPTDGDLYRQQTERPYQKCFRCQSVEHLIAKCPKPPKVNEKQQNTVRFNERGNCASQK